MKALILSVFIWSTIVQVVAQDNLITENSLGISATEYAPTHYPSQSIFFINFIQAHLNYPALAIEQNIEGEVVALLNLEADGAVKSVDILHGIGFGCDEEVYRLITSMPPWAPALPGEKPIASKVKINVRFRLQ